MVRTKGWIDSLEKTSIIDIHQCAEILHNTHHTTNIFLVFKTTQGTLRHATHRFLAGILTLQMPILCGNVAHAANIF